MNGWMDRAEKQLWEAYERGDMSNKEYDAEMRDLRDELQQSAEEAADEAYENVMNGY